MSATPTPSPRRGLCALPVRHHHRHVPDHAWHPHMRCNAKLPSFVKPFPILSARPATTARTIPRPITSFPHRGDVGCFQRPGALEKPQGRSAVFRGVQLRRLPRERHCRGVQVSVGHGESKAVATAGSRHAQVAAVLPRHAGGAGGLKRNYELITAMDAWVGEHLRALEESGEADNTSFFSGATTGSACRGPSVGCTIPGRAFR